MLSIGKVVNADYPLRSIAGSAEEYYLGHGEAAGVWLGSGRGQFDLDGPVEADALRAVIDGRDPRGGEQLAAANRRVAGFDLCFHAPKSVSVLYGLGDPDVARVVGECHDDAVRAGLDYLERAAGWSRRGHNGLQHVRTPWVRRRGVPSSHEPCR